VKQPDTAAFGHRVWPARAGALTLIRGEVRRWLAPLEVLPDAEADLVLAVSEAASNVIDHAYRTGDETGDDRAVVEVFFWTEPGAVLLEVVDHGPELVVDRPGELMVNRVAHRAETMR
jgi:anti-sigma regulatory factor (Ser/Thr protein kinase)